MQGFVRIASNLACELGLWLAGAALRWPYQRDSDADRVSTLSRRVL